MNEAQYRELCEACDRVLLAQELTIERVAISWLHVIREHPVFLVKYKDLFGPKKTINGFTGRWLRILRTRAGWLRQLIRAFRSSGQPWYGSRELPQRIEFLFVSHLLNSSQAGQTDDFYFSNVPGEMAKKNHSSLIALINHSDRPARFLADSWRGGSLPRVVLSTSLGIKEEIALHRRLIKESNWLRNLAKQEVGGLFRQVVLRASEEAMSGGSRSTLRMGEQIGALVTKLNPKAIVVTHEGHAWERVAFAAARRARPGIRCIGYQHAALFRLQHAIRRSLALEYNPDQILTAGEIGKIQLENSTLPKDIHTSVLGSNRRNSVVSSQEACSTPGLTDKYSKKHTCLVLPEGYISECNLLFRFSLLCAKACRDIQFIWRLHPIISFDHLTTQNSSFKKLPANILLSKRTFAQDLDRSDWALYRGSTAIIQAVRTGLRPVYLELPDEMTVDPLYELQDWRMKITEPEDLIDVMNNAPDYHKLQKFNLMREKAKDYCSRFYMPLDPSMMLKKP